MQEIVERLQEKRKIEVAKSILESAGYKVVRRLKESSVYETYISPVKDLINSDDIEINGNTIKAPLKVSPEEAIQYFEDTLGATPESSRYYNYYSARLKGVNYELFFSKYDDTAYISIEGIRKDSTDSYYLVDELISSLQSLGMEFDRNNTDGEIPLDNPNSRKISRALTALGFTKEGSYNENYRTITNYKHSSGMHISTYRETRRGKLYLSIDNL